MTDQRAQKVTYGEGNQPAALAIVASESGADAARRALDHAGIRLARIEDFAGGVDALVEQSAPHLIMIEAAGAEERLADALFAQARTRMDADVLALVASVSDTQIDLAAAHLMGRGAQILCAPTDVERVTALIAAASRMRSGLNDATRDAETARLQRLHEEVARIADTLAQLSRGEETLARTSPSQVRDPGSGYRGPDGAALDVTAQDIRAVIRARRLREQFFDGELFADPAWDMLLDLFAAELETRRVSVSSLCIAAAVPPTTALRWIGAMHDAGLFERQADPADRRRAYIALSGKGRDAMRGYSAAVKRQGLTLV